jgi:hypothetical protein
MSHITTIQFQENWNIKTLELMCQLAGWQFNKNKGTYSCYHKWMGDTAPPPGFTAEWMENNYGRCDHEITIPDAKYSIGILEKDGKTHLLWDFWNKGYGLQNAIGKDGGKLKQAYSIAKTIEQCAAEGKKVVLHDGSITSFEKDAFGMSREVRKPKPGWVEAEIIME